MKFQRGQCANPDADKEREQYVAGDKGESDGQQGRQQGRETFKPEAAGREDGENQDSQ